MKKILTLNVMRKWFEMTRDGQKPFDLRVNNEYWRKKLVGKSYDEVHLCCGYPRRGDLSKRLVFKWGGYTSERVVHEHFGTEPVDVFRIALKEFVANAAG